MLKPEIISLLQKNHDDFFSFMESIPADIFNSSVMDKWSPYQNLEHIKKAVQPLVLAYSIPKFLLSIAIGKSNRPSKTYTVLIDTYHAKLQKGGKASGRFLPDKKGSSKNYLITKTKIYIHKISSSVENNWSESALDEYIFPHPLLGKITAREMLYFTAYHVQHHKENVQKYYVI